MSPSIKYLLGSYSFLVLNEKSVFSKKRSWVQSGLRKTTKEEVAEDEEYEEEDEKREEGEDDKEDEKDECEEDEEDKEKVDEDVYIYVYAH